MTTDNIHHEYYDKVRDISLYKDKSSHVGYSTRDTIKLRLFMQFLIIDYLSRLEALLAT